MPSTTFRLSDCLTAEQVANIDRVWGLMKEKARVELLLLSDLPIEYREFDNDGRRCGRWSTIGG